LRGWLPRNLARPAARPYFRAIQSKHLWEASVLRNLFLRVTSIAGVIAILGVAVYSFNSFTSTASASATSVTQQPAGKQVIGNPSSTLTPGILIGNTLYLSGQLGTRGRAEGVAGETKAAIESAQNILKAAQMDLTDVVAVTAYLVDVNDFQTFNQAYTAMFSTQPRPTRTTVIVKELVSQAKVELTMTAVKAR
jgi:enamine deaminase RidA (YjgF/YER057c/UK114 family)